MNGKQVGAIITLIVAIPTLFALMSWSSKVARDPGNVSHIEEGVKIAIDDAIPWWLGLLQWLAGLPGIIGAALIIGLILFLKWIGEIK